MDGDGDDGDAGRLLRTAVLLTGDRRAGEELVVDVLASARRTPRGAEVPEDALRAALVGRYLRRGDGQAVADLADAGGRTAPLREALLRLDATERTALVLRHHDGLPEEEVARLLRRPPDAVRDDLARARLALPAGGYDVGEELAALAGELTWPDPTVPPEAVAARRGRRRRTRVGLAGAALAAAGLLGVGVPAAADRLGPPPVEADAGETAPTTRTPTAREVEEARQAARSALEDAAVVLGAAPALTSPAEWDQWLPEGRPAQGSTGQEDEDTCPPLAGRLSADLGLPMAYWTGALPRGPVGCTWVPGPVPLSQGGPYDYAQVVSVGFVAGSAPTTIEELRTLLLPGAGRGAPCPSADVPGGGVLVGCTGPTDGYEAPLALAVPDARGAGVWVLSATVEWGADRSTAEVLAVLVEAVRPVYG